MKNTITHIVHKYFLIVCISFMIFDKLHIPTKTVSKQLKIHFAPQPYKPYFIRIIEHDASS